MGTVNRFWPRHEIQKLFELRDVRQLAWSEIGSRLNRPPRNCASRYHGAKRAMEIAAAAEKGIVLLKPIADPDPSEVKIMLADREARAAARNERDTEALSAGIITPVFFGDPPPGYSALDEKRRAQA